MTYLESTKISEEISDTNESISSENSDYETPTSSKQGMVNSIVCSCK